ncbi:MAG TPA: methylmalonyl-CoA epimerase [Dehalococcoidia bacterium]|nr:methylmalonyl-CoA epimerase [Dehalococcoidia bacterium]HIN37884.1 methylmalonyl-CoA epimerase [Dehalococcoidia bacterium]
MTEVCTVNYIDHVGVAVKDIEAALAFFKKVFDVPDAEIVLMEDQGVRATLIEVGQTRLELLEPTGPESGVGRFIERRGEGLHHLAFNVTDISGKLQTLQTLGVDLIDQTPREGLSGTIAFVHPRSVFGILTELVESNPE